MDPDLPLPPLPSEVEAALTKPVLDTGDIAALYRFLDYTPLCMAWPTPARMFVRRLIERAEKGAAPRRTGRAW